MPDTYELRALIHYEQRDAIILWPLLLECNGAAIGKWRATSGQRRFQSLSDVWTRGKGAIPPTDLVEDDYYVETLPQVKPNLGGLAFQIHPVTIREKGGDRIRSEAFIHLDTPPEGSAMCPVMQPEVFLSFIKTFYGLYVLEKIERVKLIVEQI